MKTLREGKPISKNGKGPYDDNIENNMSDKKLLTRREAAELLGVSTQTVTNYANRGAITMVVRNKMQYFLREEIEILRELPESKEINDILSEIKAYKQELDAIDAEYQEKVKERKAFIRSSMRTWDKFCDLVKMNIDIVSSKMLSEREKYIIDDILRGKTYSEIADRFNLTSERIRMIVIKSIKKMEQFPDIVNELKTRDEEIENLKKEISSLQDVINNMPVSVKDTENTDKDQYPFTLHIGQLGLSVRCLNCLRALDISTVRDIVNKPRIEFLKLRNFGKKSMMELEATLQRLNVLPEDWYNSQKKELQTVYLNKQGTKLPFQVWYNLARNGIKTLADLILYTENEIRSLNGIKDSHIKPIKAFLERNNQTFNTT